MSVLIKGINVHRGRCWECPCLDGEYGDCNVLQKDVHDIEYEDCPLIELPDHGDLIDRAALIKCLRDYACKPCKEYGADKNGDRCEWCSFDDAFARIEKAKRIIPAERSEE